MWLDSSAVPRSARRKTTENLVVEPQEMGAYYILAACDSPVALQHRGNGPHTANPKSPGAEQGLVAPTPSVPGGCRRQTRAVAEKRPRPSASVQFPPPFLFSSPTLSSVHNFILSSNGCLGTSVYAILDPLPS